MEPTLIGCQKCTDDHVLVDKFSYRFHNPHQSDIVVFDRPKNLDVNEKILIKRVIAIPGDRVALKQGLVYVNGKRLKEGYVNSACGHHPTQPETRKSTWTIPKNDYFVMGDNRCNSTDSRTFGPIPKSSIVGRAFAIIWPLKRIGGI
jgi:signal peptidase I